MLYCVNGRCFNAQLLTITLLSSLPFHFNRSLFYLSLLSNTSFLLPFSLFLFPLFPIVVYLLRKILGLTFEGLLVLKYFSNRELHPWQNILREGPVTLWYDSVTCNRPLPWLSLLFVLLPDSPVQSVNDHVNESVKIRIRIVLSDS